jgi:hypothetical protein
VLRVGRWLLKGYWLAILVVAAFYILLLESVVQFPLFSAAATADEQLAYYTVARNFVRFGFMNSLFLHDMSTSANPAQHPFVYTHMPPGPEILVSLIMRIVGERFQVIRLILALVFLVGLVYFVRFAGLVLNGIGLDGQAYALALMSPWPILHAMDHPAYSAFPFFVFFPLVSLDSYYRTGRRRHYVLALCAIFLSSFYVTVHNVLIIAVSWSLAHALGLFPIRRRDLWSSLAVAAAGVLLQFLRIAAWLGPVVFLQDLIYTVSNRMFGVPTWGQLMAFYREHDLVLHGTHTLQWYGLLRALNGALASPGRPMIILLAVVALAWGLLRESGRVGQETSPASRPVPDFCRLGAWVFGIAAVPLLLFPAYSGDYDLRGLTGFFVAIGAVAVFSYALHELHRRSPSLAGRGAVAIVCVIAAGWVFAVQWGNWERVVREYSSGTKYAAILELEERLRGKVVMTNVYPHTVGFFTRDAVFGGCESQAFSDDGGVKPAACHTAWIRGYGRMANVRPTHYVLFRALFTGFTTCKGECLDQLSSRVSARHDKLFETDIFTVFTLRS